MTNRKGFILAVLSAIACFCLVDIASAESFELWAKRTRAAAPDTVQPCEGNVITLTKAATVEKVEGDATAYTIWRVDPAVEMAANTSVAGRADPDAGTASAPLSAETTRAYEEYMEAYNAMTRLMAAGKGGTPEGKEAYQKFSLAKEKYDDLLKHGGQAPVKVTTGEPAIGTLGRERNRFQAQGAPGNLEILSSYWKGGTAEWSTPVTFNGGSIGPVDHHILYTGEQADGYNTGFLVYAPRGKNRLEFKVFHFSWADAEGRKPHGTVHYSGQMNLHNKTPMPASLRFTRQSSRLCEIEWRTTDGSSCRASLSMYKKGGTVLHEGYKDLGCEEGVYEPVVSAGVTVAGLYSDEKGNNWHITRDGKKLTIKALENKGPVGWKTVNGSADGERINAIFGARVEFGDVFQDGARIQWTWGGVWSRFNASPSAADIEAHSFQQPQLAGLWVSEVGHHIRVTQNDGNLTLAALENKGPIGWKTLNAKLSYWTVSFLSGSRVVFGKVSDDGNRIDWGAGLFWNRVNASPSAADIDAHSNNQLQAGTDPHALKNWDVSRVTLKTSERGLMWDSGNHRSISWRHPISMENVVIEFDGWCAANGLAVYWLNDEKLGYFMTLGGWFNTRSCSDGRFRGIGTPVEQREHVDGSHIQLGRWQRYKIVRSGDWLDYYVDGVRIIHRQIASRYEGKGTLHFTSYGSAIGVDNLKINHAASAPAGRSPEP